MPDAQYYFILDLRRLGKIENYVPYIYDPVLGWQIDDNTLMDRVMGYDGELIGCISMLSKVEAISEQEAQNIMSQQ